MPTLGVELPRGDRASVGRGRRRARAGGTSRVFAVALLCFVVLVCFAVLVDAAVANELGDSPEVDNEAVRLVQSMGAFLATQPQRRFTAEVTYDVALEDGQWVEVHERHEVAAQVPALMHTTVVGAGGALAVIFNQGRLTVLDAASDQYYEGTLDADLSAALDVLLNDTDMSVPAVDFLYPNPADGLLASVDRATYLGVELVNGVACHHLALRQPGLDWQLWVATAPYPTPRRLALTYTSTPGAPRFQATLDWVLSPVPFDAAA
ncbi:MAG: DUF2092 domain-containing protein, partial [Pseudomonadota bacterium]